MQQSESNGKIAELQKEINDFVQQRNKVQTVNSELVRRVEDLENQVNQLLRVRQALSQQLEEAKANVEDEAQLRTKLANEHKNLQANIEHLKEQLEDEHVTKADLQRQLTKAVGEATSLRQKLETAEAGVRPEELEDVKRKMGVRIQDSEVQLEAALSKIVGAEKMKNRLQMELETLATELEKVSAFWLQDQYF